MSISGRAIIRKQHFHWDNCIHIAQILRDRPESKVQLSKGFSRESEPKLPVELTTKDLLTKAFSAHEKGKKRQRSGMTEKHATVQQLCSDIALSYFEHFTHCLSYKYLFLQKMTTLSQDLHALFLSCMSHIFLYLHMLIWSLKMGFRQSS